MKSTELKALNQDFFLQPTLKVAEDLLGKVLVFDSHQGVITETEAYFGFDDPASHAARGKTPRTEVMFAKGGCTYVYLIYGMYFCLNIVTEQEGFPAAVLIRGIKLLTPPYTYLNGPGKLCRFLGITKEHNAMDITSSGPFFISDRGIKPDFNATSRIGIKVGIEHPWRFIMNDPEKIIV
jgi:DNA-3-methyladenine glycosylase